MTRLPASLNAWGRPDFPDVLRREIEQLGTEHLPLRQALARGSHVLDEPVQARIIAVREDAATLRIKAGVFYASIIAGCSCADDPTPVDSLSEYCELDIAIDKASAAATVTLAAG